MELVLYFAPGTCAIAPYITLTEAGADFQVRAMNLRKKEQMTPDYLKLNPKHKVPVLAVDGQPLTENVAIHTWIDHCYPDARIFPADPWLKVKALSYHSWCSGGIHPHLARFNSPEKYSDLPGFEENIRTFAREHLFENFGIADGILKDREFFFDHFTAPDAHFFWCFRRATQFELDLSGFPNCQAHFDRMTERASVKKMLDFEKGVIETFAKAA